MVSGESERRSWGPRILAPLAFFLAATVLVLVINNSLSADTEEESAAPTVTQSRGSDTTATGSETGSKTTAGPQRKRFYRIQAGDTLEGIAQRFDTTVDDLLQLNPGIEATSLTPGQRVRVR